MAKVPWIVGVAVVCIVAPGLRGADADARRGAEFFANQKCNTCHSTGGARDLGRTLDRDYTPAAITAQMWNHAPSMWAAMAKAKIAPPDVSEGQAGDLFAFLYSARYFDKPGDAGRGLRAFQTKHCAECHAVGKSGATGGPAVSKWRSMSDPIALVDQLWNHVPQMKAEFAKRKLKWPEMTSQDLADILVYLRNLPDTQKAAGDFLLPPPENGEELFKQKGCTECHHGALALDRRLQDKTLTDIAAAMWNHSPKMKQGATPISYEEMRQMIGYLWSAQFFEPRGDPAKGKRVFEAKRCSTCHSSNAPAVGTLPAMVSALWKHGPTMLATMEQKGVDWPMLTASEVSSLVAYLKK